MTTKDALAVELKKNLNGVLARQVTVELLFPRNCPEIFECWDIKTHLFARVSFTF